MSEQDARSEAIEAVAGLLAEYGVVDADGFAADIAAALLEPRKTTCTTCDGRAVVPGMMPLSARPCPSCNGSGTVSLPALATLNTELEQVACYREHDDDHRELLWGWVDSPTPWTALFRAPPMTEQEN